MKDVRCKMLLFLIIAIASFIAKDLLYNCILFSIIVLICFCIGQIKFAVKYIAIYAVFVALYFSTYLLPGVIGGIVLMVTLTARMFIPILLYAKSFIASTKVCEMITALYSIKLPRAFVITLAVAVRFFPSAGYEIKQIQTAMKLRGIEISVNTIFTRPILVLESFIVPLLVRASTIADELSAASITRGLDNPNPRTSFFILKTCHKDVVLTVLFSVAIITVLSFRMIL